MKKTALSKWQDFFRDRRVSAAIFCFLSAAILLFGFLEIKKEIAGPFKFLEKDYKRNQEYAAKLKNEEEDKVLALKNKDTDKDGLSDFEESYIYSTSPYLEDTDGDGVSDRKEIDAGTNPACPEGQVCGSPSGDKINGGATASSLENNSSSASQESANLSGSIPSSDPNVIRRSLIASGMSKEMLDSIDDETLKKVYNETIRETGVNPAEINSQSAGQLPALSAGQAGSPAGEPSNSNSSPDVSSSGDTSLNPSNSADFLNYFQNMSPTELRQLLVSYGMNSALLEEVDDATLKSMAEEALKKQAQ